MQHRGTQRLETDRLILRRFCPEDAQAMYENWASDGEVTRFLTWPTHASPAVSRMVLEDWAAHYAQDDGYCIGRRWWHMGVTSEALREVLRFLFAQVGVLRVDAKHDARNPHSGGVMRKCGMRYEGTLRQSAWCNAGIGDMCWYGILAEGRVFRLRPRARAQNFPARGLRPHRVARRRGIADRRRYPVSGSGFVRAGGCFFPDVRVDFPVHRAIRWQRHVSSRGRQRFCLSPAHGHSVLRHCRSAATPLFHDLCHRMGRLRVPVPAFRLFRLVCAGEGPYRFPSARGDPRRDSAVRARAVRRHPNRGYPFRPADRRPAVLATKIR